MAFSDFKSVEQVIQKYPLNIRLERFIPDAKADLPPYFLENLNFSLEQQAIQESESFYRENFIFPFLHRAWKGHPSLKLWINRALVYNQELFGEPDYFVSARVGDQVVNRLVNLPMLAVAEAKRQDFEQGWGQCLAEMIACQKLNANAAYSIYGIVSTGLIWQFGRLEQETFTLDLRSYAVNDPEMLFAAVDFVFADCERQLNSVLFETHSFASAETLVLKQPSA